MTEFTCPECDGELDDSCSDGLACPVCRESDDYKSIEDGEEDPDLEDKDLED